MFFKLIHFSYVLGIIVVAWVFISLILYKDYRGSLKKALTGFRESGKSVAKSMDLPEEIRGNIFSKESDFINKELQS